MTHEEKARYEQIARECLGVVGVTPVAITRVANALASAEKNGREDERPKAFGSGFTSGWNEAIEAARKEIMEFPREDCEYGICEEIAESINKLKRG